MENEKNSKPRGVTFGNKEFLDMSPKQSNDNDNENKERSLSIKSLTEENSDQKFTDD